MSLEKTIKSMKNLTDDKKVKLFVVKQYVNQLDTECFNKTIQPFVHTEIPGDIEDYLLESHHEIIANMIRDVNKTVFDGNIEDTLSWMEKELNHNTYEAFNCIDFSN